MSSVERDELIKMKEIDEEKTKLARVAGVELATKIYRIVEQQKTEKQAAFYQTTTETIMGGADYSQCTTIKEMAAVYSKNIVSKYF